MRDVRGIPIALGLLLVLAPAAAATRTFEVPRATGDVIVRATVEPDTSTTESGASVLMVGHIGRGARILAPKALGARGLSCVDGRPLQRCVRLKRGSRGNEWSVLQPVKLWHEQDGAFAIAILGAADLREVVYMGVGVAKLRGQGVYSTDGAEPVSYAEADRTVTVTLEP